MKNKILLVLIAAVLIGVPNNALAASYVPNDFAETIADEISVYGDVEEYSDYINKLESTDLSSYEEASDKVNVYVFRGSTCTYCLKAITFFASLVPEYGDKFNLITYEVWANAENATLMNNVAGYLNATADGVPFIVIGEKNYVGYAETYDSEIIADIEEQYELDEKVDAVQYVIDNNYVAEETDDTTIQSTTSSNTVLSWLTLIISASSLILLGVLFQKSNNDKIEIKKQIEAMNIIKEEKKTTTAKKPTTKKTTKTIKK